MQTTETSHDVLEAATLLVTAGVLSHSGHAILSGRSGSTGFVVTATEVIRELTADQLAIVGLDGDVVEGELDPEYADIVAMHSVVYRARPDVGGIVHTHSPAATAFALAHQPLPCRTEQLLRAGQAEAVPVVAWGLPGSDVPVHGIAGVLADWPTTNAVLLANHGLLAFGADPLAAARLIIAVEDSAEAELAAARVGGGIDFPPGVLQAAAESMAKGQAGTVINRRFGIAASGLTLASHRRAAGMIAMG
jgi:L-ribulose-5-phosphate 4-epimerase